MTAFVLESARAGEKLADAAERGAEHGIVEHLRDCCAVQAPAVGAGRSAVR